MSDAVIVSLIGGGVTVIVAIIGVVVPYLRLKAASTTPAPPLPDPPDDDRYVLTTLGNHEARLVALENARITPQPPPGGP